MGQTMGPWLQNPADFQYATFANYNSLAPQGPMIQTGVPTPISPLAGSLATPPVSGVGAGLPGGMSAPGAVGLGMNIGTGQLALGALQAGANIWTSMQAQDLAKKTFAFNKDIANTNLNNSIRAYNTQLEDRAGSRAAYMADSGGFDAAGYVDRNRARRG